MFNDCQDARQACVRLLKASPQYLGGGCKRPDMCRTVQVRQIRSFRRIIDGLAASSGSDRVRKLQRLLPRVPKKSIFCKYVDGVAFWSALNSLVKEMTRLTPGQARGKSLHAPCSCYSEYVDLSKKHRAGVSRSDDVSPEYLGFVKQCTSRLFPRGWDSSYESAATTSIVSSNACFERGRRHFGPLMDYRSQVEYLDKVLGLEDFEFSPFARFSQVLSAGKVRPLTITSSCFEVLRPLHKTLFNFMSKCPWLLRGSPTPGSFGFINDPGVFVSVDFEASTDNLSVNAAEAILGCALGRASHVPPSIKKAALESLRPVISYNKLAEAAGLEEPTTLQMGQMMGSLLSFPLLCLQTFFFYLWSAELTNLSGRELREFRGCLVNGDDLVFKSNDPDSFFRAASETCSIINTKKTQVSPRFFNINSTLFKLQGSKCRSVPFVRPKQLDVSSPVSVGRQVFETTRWLSPRSSLQKRLFDFMMRRAAKVVQAHGWSFFKCGFSGRKQEAWLRKHGFIRWEAELYCHNPVEQPVPENPAPEAEPMVYLPEEWASFAPFAPELTMLYNAWARFEKDLPIEREKWNLEAEVRRSKFNVNKAEANRVKRVHKARKMGYPVTSRFPLAIKDRVFRSMRSVRSLVSARLLSKEEKRVSIPRGLLELLQRPSRRPLLMYEYKEVFVHRAVMKRLVNLFRRVPGTLCS